MPEKRSPVHAVYGGAHLFRREVASKLGRAALGALEAHAGDEAAFASTFGLPSSLAARVRARLVEKLTREPVEDYRIDFEDGFGARSDAEEDAEARRAAAELAEGLAAGELPPFVGLRIKPLAGATRKRGLRTLELFLSSLAAASARRLPPEFVVTLPKASSPSEPAALAKALASLERKLELPARSIGIELMFETAASLVAPDGRSAPRSLVRACGGRCRSAHFGPYDFTADCGVADASLGHPLCSFGRHALQVALAGTGVRLSDGPTSVLPVGDSATVRSAWKLHFDDASRSLASGYPQGWDLHPAQLVSRFTAVYAHYLERLPSASARLRSFTDAGGRAGRTGASFDDAATGRGLRAFFAAGLACGAVSAAEASAAGYLPQGTPA